MTISIWGSGTGVRWLCDGPLPQPKNWLNYVNDGETAAALEALRRSVQRGAPSGAEPWQRQTAEWLGLESSLRKVGRPKKRTADEKI